MDFNPAYDIVQQKQGLGIPHGHDDERLVIIGDAHFKYRGNFIGNFAGYGPEGGGASSGIDDADAAADLSAQIFGKANADCHLAAARGQLLQIATSELAFQYGISPNVRHGHATNEKDRKSTRLNSSH